MLGAIVSIFGNMFGTAKAGNKILGMIDDSVETPQEKTGAYLDWIKATTGSRLARRFIAIMTVGVFLIMCLVLFVLAVLSFPDLVKAGLQVMVDTEMVYIVGLIISFYFVSGIARK